MKRLVFAAALALGSPAAAQQVMGEYFTLIGPNDFFNSSGARLRDFCAIVQQDRANYHRFGRRDDMDGGDGFFGDRSNRAAISANCSVARGSGYVRDRVLNGEQKFIWVRVLGSGGRVTGVIVSEGAG